MEAASQTEYSTKPSAHIKRRVGFALVAILLVALGIWFWRANSSAAKPKGAGAVQVVSAVVAQTDVSVSLTANGTVSALQTVEVRPQISATIKAVHIKEGQFVRKGDRLFSLDARTEDANLSKNAAQVAKDRVDLMNAERNFERQRELFRQEYISRAEFEAAQNQMDGLRGQLEVDSASLDASRVARSFGEITAPITGRTGAIAIYPGSLVQPGGTALGAALVSITQIDPINVSFTLPERELVDLQQAFAKGEVPVGAKLDLPGQPYLKGRLAFIDNAVDTASGTIRLKAEFPNPGHRLWPGMFVTVTLTPRTLDGAATVPVQAVQTGPEKKFIYVIGEDRKVASQPVNVRLIQDGIAVIEGVAPGARVVVEGAQNLRPGSLVVESEDRQSPSTNKGGAKPNNAVKQ
ncbi:MAG: efflux transporter periplasmic adaptor subunit [Gallionellales bacterium GWA2_55_18]|nr:MAG: efflux transporter periplasmic adaptor subunit [Gallionellales bacterium GWA2_55_18]